MQTGFFYTSPSVTPNRDRGNLQVSKIFVNPAPDVESVTPKGNSSNEDRLQVSKIVEDPAPDVEPVTTKGNSSNEDICNSQSSNISEDLDTYLDNKDAMEYKSATDISSDESEYSLYDPPKEDLLSSDEDSHKPQEINKKM